MKLLLTESGKIFKMGEFVFPNGKEQVVILEDVTISNIKEIAKFNDIILTKKKKDDIINEIKEQLILNNTEQVNEMSEEQNIEQIVIDGFAAEKDDNAIKSDMFKAGCDFGNINKVFNKAIADNNLRMSPKDRKEKTAEFLEGYEPVKGDVEALLSKITALQDHLDCSTTQAGASMRTWAKVNEIELPKAPATPTVAPGFRGNIKLVADHAIANQDVDFEGLVKFASENVPATKGGKDNSRGYAVQVWNAILFAKAYNAPAEAVETTEEEMV